MFFLAILTIIIFIMTARSGLVLLGMYKDPLLASFETYGDESFSSPLFSMIIGTASLLYLSLYWYFPPSLIFGMGLVIIIPLASLYSVMTDLLKKYKHIFNKYPRWLYELLQMTDREERRRIAYMWLFLPPSTRMIYNANNYLFRQWVEQVLLTVASSAPPSARESSKA